MTCCMQYSGDTTVLCHSCYCPYFPPFEWELAPPCGQLGQLDHDNDCMFVIQIQRTLFIAVGQQRELRTAQLHRLYNIYIFQR